VRAFALLGLTTLLAAALSAASRSVASASPAHGSSAQAAAQQPPAGATPQAPGAAGQVPGAPGTPPPPPAVPASRKFTADGGVIFSMIKPDKGPDFEAVMAKVKEALAKSDNPKRKQMALTWRVFKGVEAGPNGALVYVFWFDPPVKDEDYQITAILGEAFPDQLQELWSKFQACFVNGQTMLNLQQVVNMSPNAPVTTPKVGGQ
jgi:hypothetical protein